jgi:photosystem II stability/assembly factor-like uncharacterized protein
MPGQGQFAMSDTVPRELVYVAAVRDADSIGAVDTLSLVTVPPALWSRTQQVWTSTGSSFTSVRFATPTVGYGLANVTAYRTTDGGETWGSPRGTVGAFEAADFPSASVGYVVTSYPSAHIFKVEVATNNWTEVTPGPANVPLMEAIDFVDEQIGYLAGNEGTIMKTVNGGATWSFPATGTTEDLYAIQCRNPGLCYAAGNSGVLLKTADGGATWSARNTTATGRITSLSVPSDRVAYAVTERKSLLKTMNGGLTWTMGTLPSPMLDAEAVHFRDEHTGFVVGTNGVILKTTDGGETWSEEPKDGTTTYTLRDVHCGENNVCYASGVTTYRRYVAP